jgi:glutathione synthase
MEYIYATHIFEHAEANGCLVLNRPQSLRDANEKLYTTWFPQCMTRTLVSAKIEEIKEFIETEETVVLKPLSGMAGQNIFKCQKEDANVNVIIETLTKYETEYCMVQRYIPEITSGDKRIILIDGEPIPYALARIPAKGEFRGNLARGGKGIGVELSDRDYTICAEIGPTLKEKGLLLVGIDVIGDYLTEINVTSPTCVREIENIFQIDIAAKFFEMIEKKLAGSGSHGRAAR